MATAIDVGEGVTDRFKPRRVERVFPSKAGLTPVVAGDRWPAKEAGSSIWSKRHLYDGQTEIASLQQQRRKATQILAPFMGLFSERRRRKRWTTQFFLSSPLHPPTPSREEEEGGGLFNFTLETAFSSICKIKRVSEVAIFDFHDCQGLLPFVVTMVPNYLPHVISFIEKKNVHRLMR